MVLIQASDPKSNTTFNWSMVSGGRKREVARRGAAPGLATSGARPASRVLAWHSSFAHPSSRALEAVRAHAMNQQLELCLPGAAGRELAEALQWETSFYYELCTSVAMFLSPAFLRDYVAHGSVYMIAKNLPIDGADAASAMLLPTGELLLLVDRETYEQLGLVGAKYGSASPLRTTSAATARFRQRYLITLDLKSLALGDSAAKGEDTAPSFRERVAEILSTRLQPLEMFLCAYNERGTTRTIIFGDDDAIERKRCELNASLASLEDVFLPRFDAFFAQFSQAATQAEDDDESGDHFRMDELRSGLVDAQDWFGLVACRLTPILQRQLPDEYVSRFSGVSDAFEYEESGRVTSVRWRGLIATEFCEALLERARQQVKAKVLPWAAIMVWGFPDALVSWKQQTRAARKNAGKNKYKKAVSAAAAEAAAWVSREHGFLENGSNNYTILLLPNDEYYLLQTLGPHDATV
jgi:ribonuclease P/MRP protein subunit RPP40